MRDGLAVDLQRDEVGVARQKLARHRALSGADLDDLRAGRRVHGVHDRADDGRLSEKVLAQTFLGTDGHGSARVETRD